MSNKSRTSWNNLHTTFENISNIYLSRNVILHKTCIDKWEFDDDEHYKNQERFSKLKEWPGVQWNHHAYKSPFIIKELYRLVPYNTESSQYIKFHVFNMPEVIVKAVEFVGIIIYVFWKEKDSYIRLIVNDGTASIVVVYHCKKFEAMKRKREEINSKHERFMRRDSKIKPWLNKQEYPECNVVHYGVPAFYYSTEIPKNHRLKLQHDWWKETNSGLLGKKFEIGDYVYVEGFCSLDFDRMKRPQGQIKAQHLSGAKLICNAVTVTCITEKEYNEKLQSYININVRKRYNTSNYTTKR